MTAFTANANDWIAPSRSKPRARQSQPVRISGAFEGATPVTDRRQGAIRVVVTPTLDSTALDVTESLVGAIAAQLWKRFGGNDVVNWLEAERLLQQALNMLRSESSQR
jgi:hypothetical protein